MGKLSRREFLKKGGKTAFGVGLSAVMTGALARSASAQDKPVGANNRVQLAAIGVGGMGMHNMMQFANMPDVDIVAVCDVDSARLDHAANEIEKKCGKKPQMFKDFRKLLEMKNLDAVSISTPDHWHALPMILACEAGIDSYLEKPIGHDIIEGKAMVGAAKKFKRVVQVGTWQRSVQHYVDAQEFVRSGKLGRITVVRAWTCGGAGVGKQKPCGAPSNLDWDFWIGPAKWEPYRPNIHPGAFRWYFNFAAGLTGDWGVHMLDTVGTFMGEWHPLEVASYGGKLVTPPDDDRTTPDTQIAIMKFPTWVLQWEIHVGEPGLDCGGHHGVAFIGERGVLRIDRNGYNWTPKGDAQKEGPTPTAKLPSDHWRNFIDCVRSREKPRSDIETMHYASTLCHLANLSYLIGRSIKWDGAKQEIIGDKEAMLCQSYQREYRKPWVLPRHDLG